MSGTHRGSQRNEAIRDTEGTTEIITEAGGMTDPSTASDASRFGPSMSLGDTCASDVSSSGFSNEFRSHRNLYQENGSISRDREAPEQADTRLAGSIVSYQSRSIHDNRESETCSPALLNGEAELDQALLPTSVAPSSTISLRPSNQYGQIEATERHHIPPQLTLSGSNADSMQPPVPFDQSMHGQHSSNDSMPFMLSNSYCQSAPPTVTTFGSSSHAMPYGSHSTNLYGMYPSSFTSASYANAYSQAHAPSTPATATGYETAAGSMAGHGGLLSLHGHHAVDPISNFHGSQTGAASVDSEAVRGTSTGSGWHGAQHHSGSTLTASHGAESRRVISPQKSTHAHYAPYTVPTQSPRTPRPIGSSSSVGGSSSIFMANPETLPDIRYTPGQLNQGAQFGRLPNGKIIELFPAMMRTLQACEYCRSRKAKCSGGLPCDRCNKKKIQCEYAQLDKKRKIKTTTSEYDMSSGAARLAANRAVEEAQAQLSAKINIPTIRDDGTEVKNEEGTSSTHRKHELRTTQSAPMLDLTTLDRQTFGFDLEGEVIEEELDVTYLYPRFTAPICIGTVASVASLSSNADSPMEQDLAPFPEDGVCFHHDDEQVEEEEEAENAILRRERSSTIFSAFTSPLQLEGVLDAFDDSLYGQLYLQYT